MALRLPRRARADTRMEIAGVDTTRHRGKLMLFTPAYHAHTDTARGGLEWVVRGNPLRVAGAPQAAGKTPIPRDGFVLSYGGSTAPPPLSALTHGTRVELETTYASLDAPNGEWASADAIVGGAGLLIRDGRTVHRLGPRAARRLVRRNAAPAYADRHASRRLGVAGDGRRPPTAVERRHDARRAPVACSVRLGLNQALNLDGGGSTTMWVQGQVVNSPSDAAGPRKVSDALLVAPR